MGLDCIRDVNDNNAVNHDFDKILYVKGERNALMEQGIGLDNH